MPTSRPRGSPQSPSPNAVERLQNGELNIRDWPVSNSEGPSEDRLATEREPQNGTTENKKEGRRPNVKDDDDDDDDDDDASEQGGAGDEGERESEGDLTVILAEDPVEMATWSGHPSVKGNSEAVRMILLCFAAIGITFTWGVEMTYCTPYLLNLGLTKSNTSLVWIAGPLSGLFTQPIVGAISDSWTSKWGRRRPFIAGGALIVALSLLTLGFTKEIVGALLGSEAAEGGFTIFLAILAIWVTDIAVNAVMSAARGLLVDVLPIQKQQSGAAWYSRLAALGHVIGYASGSLDLVAIFGTSLGDTQFKKLTIVAATTMLFTSGLSCWAVTERVLVSVKEDPATKGSRFKPVWTVLSALRNLPPRISGICWAYFWSWIGWFPFLFYSTTWVGETYFRYDVPGGQKDSKDALGNIGRIGSTSMTIYSLITLVASVVLPVVVRAPDDNEATSRPPEWLAKYLNRFATWKPDLLTVWMWGHIVFSATMIMAPFARSYRFATFLVAMCGIPWAITMWAPLTFLGVEVNRMSGAPDPSHSSGYRRISGADSVEMDELDSEARPDLAADPASTEGELSGIYFGILNIYATVPQFIGSFISGTIFAILDPGKSPELSEGDAKPSDGPNAIAVCLFIGAICAVLAAVMTHRLKHL